MKTFPKLHLIPLDPNLHGFVDFIGAWVFQGEKTFLVDVGPANTVPALAEALNGLGVRHLDAILLTHLHIDHAGGTGDFLRHFPDTPVVCHASGFRHLADPSRLWQGSLKILGNTARAYGPIRPVPPGLILDAAEYRESGVEAVPTPGHAPHHVSFLVDAFLFAGEAGGILVDLPGGDPYLRPATPPRFFLDTYLESLDALVSRDPQVICYGHFGTRTDARRQLKRHRQQLLLWERIVGEELERAGEGKGFAAACTRRLLEEDPCLKGLDRLDPSVQDRERDFMKNSINGFRGWLMRDVESSP